VTLCSDDVGNQCFRAHHLVEGSSMNLWNVGILSQHDTTRHHNTEDGGSMDLWNVCILPQHYKASRPWRWRKHGPPKGW
jgi:hypothetical protein